MAKKKKSAEIGKQFPFIQVWSEVGGKATQLVPLIRLPEPVYMTYQHVRGSLDVLWEGIDRDMVADALLLERPRILVTEAEMLTRLELAFGCKVPPSYLVSLGFLKREPGGVYCILGGSRQITTERARLEQVADKLQISLKELLKRRPLNPVDPEPPEGPTRGPPRGDPGSTHSGSQSKKKPTTPHPGSTPGVPPVNRGTPSGSTELIGRVGKEDQTLRRDGRFEQSDSSAFEPESSVKRSKDLSPPPPPPLRLVKAEEEDPDLEPAEEHWTPEAFQAFWLAVREANRLSAVWKLTANQRRLLQALVARYLPSELAPAVRYFHEEKSPRAEWTTKDYPLGVFLTSVVENHLGAPSERRRRCHLTGCGNLAMEKCDLTRRGLCSAHYESWWEAFDEEHPATPWDFLGQRGMSDEEKEAYVLEREDLEAARKALRPIHFAQWVQRTDKAASNG